MNLILARNDARNTIHVSIFHFTSFRLFQINCLSFGLGATMGDKYNARNLYVLERMWSKKLLQSQLLPEQYPLHLLPSLRRGAMCPVRTPEHSYIGNSGPLCILKHAWWAGPCSCMPKKTWLQIVQPERHGGMFCAGCFSLTWGVVPWASMPL